MSLPDGPAWAGPAVVPIAAAPPDAWLARALIDVTDLTAEASDRLEALGLRLAVPASRLSPLTDASRIVGRALTLRYGLARRAPELLRAEDPSGRLGNAAVARVAAPGDVLVIESPDATVSVLGGEAAEALVSAGTVGVVADGAVRDVEALLEQRLPVWAAARTPATGRWRLEALEIGGVVTVGGVTVLAGDVVFADAGGVCFVPADRFEEVARSILALDAQ